MTRDELKEHCKRQVRISTKLCQLNGTELEDSNMLAEHQLVLDIIEELRLTRAAFKKYILDHIKVYGAGFSMRELEILGVDREAERRIEEYIKGRKEHERKEETSGKVGQEDS